MTSLCITCTTTYNFRILSFLSLKILTSWSSSSLVSSAGAVEMSIRFVSWSWPSELRNGVQRLLINEKPLSTEAVETGTMHIRFTSFAILGKHCFSMWSWLNFKAKAPGGSHPCPCLKCRFIKIKFYVQVNFIL